MKEVFSLKIYLRSGSFLNFTVLDEEEWNRIHSQMVSALTEIKTGKTDGLFFLEEERRLKHIVLLSEIASVSFMGPGPKTTGKPKTRKKNSDAETSENEEDEMLS